ncbi:hypothetical protein [Vibrio parahaemolyticus]|uniref:hypothetical protein n=1 Tax=Vibrio parahaemolyticus TaxID=670 RepID=UPI00235E50BF|nr:hypothetical protein [Vibrio parahaemolyticus]
MSLKEKYEEFKRGFTDDFAKTNQYITTGNITKSTLVMVSAMTLSGCNFFESEYTSNLKEFSQDHPSQITDINEQSLRDIADGKSGVFRDQFGEIVFISNYDEGENYTQSQRIALENSIPKHILEKMESRSAYKEGVSDDEPYAIKSARSEAHFINIETGKSIPLLEELNVDTAFIKSDKEADKMVALHEFGHFLTKRHIPGGYGDYTKELVNEVAADNLGTLLYAKIENLSYTQFNQLINDQKEERERAAIAYLDLSHYTSQGFNMLQSAIERNPSLYGEIKNMDINQLTNVSVKLSTSMNSSISHEEKNEIDNLTSTMVISDIHEMQTRRELSTDSYAANYFPSDVGIYKNYINAINDASKLSGYELYEKAENISKVFSNTNQLISRSERVSISSPEVIALESYIKEISESNNSRKYSEIYNSYPSL